MSGERHYYVTSDPVIWQAGVPESYVLYLLKIVHLNTEATQYAFIFDQDDEPDDGDYPLDRITLYPDGFASYTPAERGRLFDVGFCIALSTTPTQLTKQTVAQMHYSLEGRFP